MQLYLIHIWAVSMQRIDSLSLRLIFMNDSFIGNVKKVYLWMNGMSSYLLSLCALTVSRNVKMVLVVRQHCA